MKCDFAFFEKCVKNKININTQAYIQKIAAVFWFLCVFANSFCFFIIEK